jgi:hypothetical protein
MAENSIPIERVIPALQRTLGEPQETNPKRASAKVVQRAISDPSQLEGKPVWKILIAYDTVAAGQRAMQLFSWLGRIHGEELDFRPQLWSFDLLADPNWRELAGADLMQADMILVAALGQSDLPAHMRTWLSACLTRRQGADAAIVALFGTEDDTDDPGSPRLKFLEGEAKAAGLQFFAPLPRSTTASAGEVYWRAPALTITPRPNDALGRAEVGQHWGIND